MFQKFYSFFLPIALVGLLTAGFLARLPGCRPKAPQSGELVIWGVYDDSDVYSALIGDFERKYPHIKVRYYKKSYNDYERDLLDALAAGQGPDIFYLHNDWLPRYYDKIYPLPEDLMTLKEFRDTFVDVAFNDLTVNDQIFGLPLFVDTLALYWNKDLFNSAGIPGPPLTWQEFMFDVPRLTKFDDYRNIVQAGAAIGTARNINRSTDILSLLMLQNGTKMLDDDRTRVVFDRSVNSSINPYPGENALAFYTQFADPQKKVYTWNNKMHYSIDAFYEGRLAMMFNYSYHISTIRSKAPYINFGISYMPQITQSSNQVNYANYWALTVSRNSRFPYYAWQFVTYALQKNNNQYYLQQAKRPSARRDLIDWQKDDLDLGVFARQALSARSWFQIDNSSIESILADMIDNVVAKRMTIGQGLEWAASRINLLMEK